MPRTPGRAVPDFLSHLLRTWPQPVLAPRTVAVLLSLWCTVALNQALWHKLAGLPDFSDPWLLRRTVIAVLVACATYLWFMLWSWPRLRRPMWSLTLVVAAVVQYYMLRYGMVMDSSMAHNVLQTNFTEGLALFSMTLVGHVLVLAGLPLLWLYRGLRFKEESARKSWGCSALVLLACLGLLVGGAMGMYRELAPLLRNHTEIRYQINPLASVVSFASVTIKPLLQPQRPFQPITAGALLGASYANAATKPPLLVLVVGETARADHFGLNGYPRDTTPEMEAHQVISWRQVQSCGTNTQASVPCMFSSLGKAGYERRKFEYGNLLDVLQAAGLGVEWLENQSGCKGVCDRVPHAQADAIATPQALRQWCKDGECLDQLMVDQLDQRLQALPEAARHQGAVLVLHQMGSHGPAYYRRSSAQNKTFQPECTTQVTSDCSHTELINVYDNSMRETDRFVGRVIDWLKTQQDQYATSLLYVSDHGESLGENGLYLHGMPYAIAPQAQKHVPWVLWPGSLQARTGMDEQCARASIDKAYTHDNYFHTVLGMLDVHSPTYKPELDMLAPCRKAG
ncbi:phosphoethanolamine transferase [Comamonas sp. GB3 AK4-5]|uniref:phosphoethanolamine transferase n=1 Tax=Comamonas sp. GB3 AK4-5 TaxID=3231487 RepID=UPI00351F755D